MFGRKRLSSPRLSLLKVFLTGALWLFLGAVCGRWPSTTGMCLSLFDFLISDSRHNMESFPSSWQISVRFEQKESFLSWRVSDVISGDLACSGEQLSESSSLKNVRKCWKQEHYNGTEGCWFSYWWVLSLKACVPYYQI